MTMKLAVDPMNVKSTEVDELADNKLVNKVAGTLHLGNNKHSAIKQMLQKLYHEFLSSYYTVDSALPEHKERAALLEVRDRAQELYEAIMALYEHGNTDKRFAQALLDIDYDEFRPEKGMGIWHKITNDLNPNYYLRELITDIEVAAKNAADLPDKNPSVEELKQAIKKETDPKKTGDLENQLFFAKWDNERDPNRHEAHKKHIADRRTPKDLPTRTSIKMLKEFFDSNVELPFTAGKYYPEIGFKSPAFNATKIILEKIYPNISDRKIASLMQETNTQ